MQSACQRAEHCTLFCTLSAWAAAASTAEACTLGWAACAKLGSYAARVPLSAACHPLANLQARQLAETVQAHGGSAAMQAEAFTLLGRACHALGQLNDAYRYYQQVSVWLRSM